MTKQELIVEMKMKTDKTIRITHEDGWFIGFFSWILWGDMEEKHPRPEPNTHQFKASNLNPISIEQ